MLFNLIASSGVCASLWLCVMAARMGENEAALGALVLALIIVATAVTVPALKIRA